MTTSDTKTLHPIAVTFIVLLAYIAGRHLPFPFCDMSVFSAWLNSFSQFSQFSQSSPIFEKISLFPFRFIPYISATVLIIFLSGFVPPLKRLRENRWKYQKIIFITSLGMTLLQSIFVSKWLLTIITDSGESLVTIPPILFHVLYGMWTAIGMAILIFLMKWSTHRGVINGLALFFVFDTIAPIIGALKNEVILLLANNSVEMFPLILSIVGIIYFTIAKKDLTIVKGEKKVPIPFYYNATGTIPFQFATSVAAFPIILLPTIFTGHVQIAGIAIIAVVAVNIILTSCYSPRETIKTLKQFGFHLSGVSEDNQEQHLRQFYKKLMFINSAVIVLAIVGIYITKPSYFHVSALFSFMPITLFVLILRDQLVESLERYKTRNEYSVLAELDTKLEARLLCELLKSENIPARIHDTRFTEITGSHAFWDLSIPKLRSFTVFPEIAGGSLSIYVHKEYIDQAEAVLDAQIHEE